METEEIVLAARAVPGSRLRASSRASRSDKALFRVRFIRNTFLSWDSRKKILSKEKTINQWYCTPPGKGPATSKGRYWTCFFLCRRKSAPYSLMAAPGCLALTASSRRLWQPVFCSMLVMCILPGGPAAAAAGRPEQTQSPCALLGLHPAAQIPRAALLPDGSPQMN